MLILQQPHQLSYQPVPFVSPARKVISLLKKTLILQSRRRWQQERQEPSYWPRENTTKISLCYSELWFKISNTGRSSQIFEKIALE